jgi:16S rRNA C967 or C1407 C5-methylase (RsmB/RsmF family)/NOL1/NOP2/fmu family ribosome biogenesis protein
LKIFPIEFRHQIEAALGDQSKAFFEALESPPPVSILANKQKLPTEIIKSARPVPWCPYGYFLNERPEFIFDPAFHAGAYYVMEASSMMLWQGLNTLFESNDNLRILDLCGAPGGKAMVTANFLGDNCLLVINEVNRSRYRVLKENVMKWGMPNVYTSNYDPSRIALDAFFDCVIVDAPCSGEGLFRKTPEAIDAWSKSNVTHCSKRQKRILTEAARMLRPGGVLLYSTCTYNTEENILNTKYLVYNQSFTSIRLNLKFNTTEQILEECHGYQCFPHLVEGEGFYISALRKDDAASTWSGDMIRLKSGMPVKASKKAIHLWEPYLHHAEDVAIYINEAGTYYAVPLEIIEDYLHTMRKLPHGSPALILGQIKGKDIVPHHSLALSSIVNEDLPRIALSADNARAYLRKDTIMDIAGDTTGWYIATYDAHSLGWFKQTSRHLKNYFPTNLRIRKRG